MTEQLYRIKPLEWVQRTDGVEIAPSVLGVYHVHGDLWSFQAIVAMAGGTEGSHEDAKRACDEDNRERLLEALEPVDQGQPQDDLEYASWLTDGWYET